MGGILIGMGHMDVYSTNLVDLRGGAWPTSGEETVWLSALGKGGLSHLKDGQDGS